MSRRRRTLFHTCLVVASGLLVLGVFALVSAATSPDTPLARVIRNRPAPSHPVSIAAKDLFQQQEVQLQDLQSRIAATTDPDAVWALEREYQKVKLQTELDLLTLQLDNARETGNTASAARLEAAVASLQGLIDRGSRADVIDDPALGQ